MWVGPKWLQCAHPSHLGEENFNVCSLPVFVDIDSFCLPTASPWSLIYLDPLPSSFLSEQASLQEAWNGSRGLTRRNQTLPSRHIHSLILKDRKTKRYSVCNFEVLSAFEKDQKFCKKLCLRPVIIKLYRQICP